MIKMIIWDAMAVPLGILISVMLYKSMANWHKGIITAETKYALENVLLICLYIVIIYAFIRYATPSSLAILGASAIISFATIYVKMLIDYAKNKKSK